MSGEVKKRSQIAEQFRWNLGDLVSSQEEAKKQKEQLEKEIPSFEAFRGVLGQTEEKLRDYLEFEENFDGRLTRLFAYAMQKSDENTADNDAQAFLAEVRTVALKAMAATAFAEPEILAIPGERMEEFLRSETLALYERKLRRLLAKKAHLLSEREEALLAKSREATQTASNVFNLFNNADLKFPQITDEEGNSTDVTHGRYGKLMESPDRRVRREAFLSLYSGYKQFANTVAAMFEGNLKQACFYGKVRNYSSSREYSLSENEIPEKVYDNLLKTVSERLPLMHRYVKIRKEVLGLSELHMYDLYAPLVKPSNGDGEDCSFEEAKTEILEALRPLGEEYLGILKTGFENRWIDVYENEGKRSGAYSNCVYGVHPYVLMSYDGTLNSALTLAHEMGHSLHSWYSNQNQPYAYADYRIFVAEVASTCNEVLFLKHKIGKAETKEEKKYLINQLLERFRATLFRQTMFAEFEWTAHQLAWEGKPLPKAVLCRLYHELNVRYHGPDMVVDEEIDYEWARIPHFYRPFYVYQYATGFAAATAIAGRILAGDKGTRSGYFEFLKGGSSMTPVELLKLCGLDMETPTVVDEALDEFEALLNEFEAL